MDGKRRATRKFNAVVFSSKEPATFNNIGAIAELSSTRPWLGNSSTDRIGYWTTMVPVMPVWSETSEWSPVGIRAA